MIATTGRNLPQGKFNADTMRLKSQLDKSIMAENNACLQRRLT